MEHERVAQFTGITGTTPDRAAQYLRLTDGNIEQAIELFFANDGVDLEGVSTGVPDTDARAESLVPAQAPQHSSGDKDVVQIDSDDSTSDENDPEITGFRPKQPEPSEGAADVPVNIAPHVNPSNRVVDDDEAIARRLQEELYAGGDIGDAPDGDRVRAPIASTRETLVGPGSYDAGGVEDMRDAVLEQMRARNRPRTHGRPGIFNQQPGPDSIWNDGEHEEDGNARRARFARATAGASEASSKSNLLAEMYRPPFEIMSSRSWEDARDDGKESEKWILVNVQDPAIFDCQVLNRDIWKNPSIKDTVKENFIFMQYSKDDPKGMQYIQYYFQARESQSAYPHIAIVDPRTGEQVKVWSGPPAPKAMDFLMSLHEFLDRYSLKVDAKNPVARRKPESKPERAVEKMSEQEMLDLALQNSLAGTTGPREDDPDDLTRSTGDLGKGKGRSTDARKEADSADLYQMNGHANPGPSPFSLISPSKPHQEPSADTASTRIQFRHPNGRVVRRFSLADPVRRIFEWLKASPLEGKEGSGFELIFMQKNLIDSVDETIEQAGLKNGTVMIEFLDESS